MHLNNNDFNFRCRSSYLSYRKYLPKYSHSCPWNQRTKNQDLRKENLDNAENMGSKDYSLPSPIQWSIYFCLLGF